MSKRRVYEAKRKTYYARHRSLPLMVDGSIYPEVDGLITRYSHRSGLKSTTGPRGGKAYRTVWRDTYVLETGQLVELRRVQDAEDQWQVVFVPVGSTSLGNNAWLADKDGIAHDDLIRTDEFGFPSSVTLEDGTTWSADDMERWDQIRHALGWDHKKRRSPRKAA